MALLWGSSVHYVSGREDRADQAQPRLTLSAKFQVALMQATRGLEVVIVPHWWWPSVDSVEGAGYRLARVLAKEDEFSITSLLPSAQSVRPTPCGCIE